MAIRVTLRTGIFESPGSTEQQIIDRINQALTASMPQVGELWEAEIRKLAPVRTGRLKRSIELSAIGGTRLKFRYIFYLPAVLDRNPDNFVEKAFLNIRHRVVFLIRLNFSRLS